MIIDKTADGVVVEIADDNGKPIKDRKLLAFEYWCECGQSNSMTAKRVGVAHNTILKWTKEQWWQDLVEAYVTAASMTFKARIASRVNEIEDAFFEVINGVDKTDRTASARVAAIKAYMEMGKNPIINKNPGNSIAFTQNNSLNYDIDISELKGMNPDDLLEIARTGVIPPHVIEKHEKKKQEDAKLLNDDGTEKTELQLYLEDKKKNKKVKRVKIEALSNPKPKPPTDELLDPLSP